MSDGVYVADCNLPTKRLIELMKSRQTAQWGIFSNYIYHYKELILIAEQSERKPSTVAENSLLIVEVCRSYHEMWKESSVKSKELQLYFFVLRIILDDVMLKCLRPLLPD